MYLLVTTRGRVLARSSSESFLKIRQKKISQKTKIIEETPAQARAAFARKVKDQKARAARQRAWWARSRNQMKRGVLLSSSFISFLEWDATTENARCILSGKKYTFLNVPLSRFNAWKDGAAACDTDDPTGLRRWEIDKHPSLGAFFNQKIKPKYSYVRGWVYD